MPSSALDDIQREAILQEYWPSIVRTASGYEYRAALRDELSQEMAMSVWRALTTFNNQCALSTYIYRVVHNVAVDHIRRYARLDEVTLEDTYVASAGSPECALDLSQRQQTLLVAVNRLPLALRQVMLLKLEGQTNIEISEVLGLSQSNIGVRLNRARQLLTGFMKGEAQ